MYYTLKLSIKSLIATLFLFLLFFSNSILALSSEWVINDKSKVRLISSKTSSDNMNNIVLGLEYKLEPGWKTYWKSPGGGGFPQKLIWNNSTNVENLEIDWPTPTDFQILGLNSLGYEKSVIFPLRIKIKDVNKTTKILLNTNYLVCKDICIPGNANLYLEIPNGKAEFTEYFYEIEKVNSSLPLRNINLSPISNVDIKTKKISNQIELNVAFESKKNFVNPKLFIHTPFGLPIKQPITNYSLNFKKINTSFKFDENQFSQNNFPIEILIYDKNHNFSFIKNITLEDNFSYKLIDNSLIYILLISLLGGFILNLMPCVFPVLSIKLISIINNQSKNIRLSFVYTAIGIVTSFLVLALFFSIFKYMGYSISWGMQFQEQYFLIFILLILSLFFLNTIGLFEIELPNFIKESKYFNSGNNFFTKNFFNGFFATILATPCTAPFVGTAITIAFTQKSIILFVIFLFMGLGMSTPYLLVSIFPKVISVFPKPGRWTLYTKYFLSFLLLLTIIWVLNILLSFYNEYFIIFFIIVFSLIYLFFKFNWYKNTIIIIFAISLFSIPSFNIFVSEETYIQNNKWTDFEDIKINDLIQNNDIIFVDITADWCVTCQYNKINIINSNSINNLFEKNNVILVRGDWTKPNINIDNFLKKHKKFGIPFNAFYSKKYPNGFIMSEILTEKEIQEAFKLVK